MSAELNMCIRHSPDGQEYSAQGQQAEKASKQRPLEHQFKGTLVDFVLFSSYLTQMTCYFHNPSFLAGPCM